MPHRHDHRQVLIAIGAALALGFFRSRRRGVVGKAPRSAAPPGYAPPPPGFTPAPGYSPPPPGYAPAPGYAPQPGYYPSNRVMRLSRPRSWTIPIRIDQPLRSYHHETRARKGLIITGAVLFGTFYLFSATRRSHVEGQL